MFTCFHLLYLVILVTCVMLGAQFGWHYGGCFGASCGAVLGVWAGLILGNVPFWVAWWMGNPRRETTENLHAHLAGEVWPMYYEWLRELHRRGESVEPYRPLVQRLLISVDGTQRNHGWHILHAVYPDWAEQLADYHPHESVESCQEKVRRLD